MLAYPPAPSHFTSKVGTDDLAVLDMLTGPTLPASTSLQSKLSPNQNQVRHKRREAPLDPLLLAATAASGPHVTRHHYHHGFRPESDGSWAWMGGEIIDEDEGGKENKKPLYISKQAPRRERLGLDTKENANVEVKPPESKVLLSQRTSKRHRSASAAAVYQLPTTTALSLSRPSPIPPPLEVKCMARTRIPTPHGEAFLHLYHNNRDSKEHLAIVVDPSQLSSSSLLTPSTSTSNIYAPHIRSRTLDAIWNDNETDRDRLLRGAYVGRLSPSSQMASPALTDASSTPSSSTANSSSSSTSSIPLPDPLVRIHSECFTGETIGSQRCDCGEQLDEGLRQIFEPIPITLPSPSSSSSPSFSFSSPSSPIQTTIPGRGAVIYLRQEGRGIGLLSKLRAYNLQDMGHDTVTANLLLGHKADERGYDIAAAILEDLGLSGSSEGGLRLLTNNPDKVRSLQAAGVKITGRVPMVPRTWQCSGQHDSVDELGDGGMEGLEKSVGVAVRASGATMIGSGKTESPELEKYLRTKIERMGHMLTVPSRQ
jgi:GTP cyclohydrolase II